MKAVTFSVMQGTVILLLASLFTMLLLSIPARGQAGEQVTARYLIDSGQTISVELSIPTVPPATIIVSQSVPPETTVISTNPEAKKTAHAGGTVKWLLDKLTPGRSILTMELDRPVASGDVQGEIRYRDPATSKPITIRISPPSK